MDLPIRPLPPVVGPSPPAPVPRVGERKRQPGEQPFSLDAEDGEPDGERPAAETPTPSDDTPIGPPPEDEAGQRVDVTA